VAVRAARMIAELSRYDRPIAVWLRNQASPDSLHLMHLWSPADKIRLVPQMRALYELGYTILSTNTYKGMIEAHKAMPDVM
jgi:hypothetical protein